jgi:uncharacterized protein
MESVDKFFESVKGGEVQAVRQMLDTAPELINLKNKEGYSAVMLAVYYHKTEMLELLLTLQPSLDIFEAAAVGRVERVRELLEQDPDLVDASAPDGFHPLGLASFFGHPEVVLALLERGAAVDSPSQNAQHVAPLNSAAAGKHVEVARLLLERGADPDIRQSGSNTPLHSAAQNGDMAMARLLIDHGADPTLENDGGQTPSDMARRMEHRDLADYLTGKQ